MLPPNLDPALYGAYLRALHSHTAQRMVFSMMKRDHTPLNNITPVAVDGQVNLNDPDGDAALRTLQASFYDADHSLYVDSDTPSDGVGGAERMVRVRAFHWVPEAASGAGDWIWVDAFTGPLAVIGRDGERVTLEAQDKSMLHLRTVPGGHLPAHTNVVTAIRNYLTSTGERFFRFPDTGAVTAKTTKKIPYGGKDEELQPWKVMRRLANRHGLQLFYDRSGFAVLRKIPAGGTPIITWDATMATGRLQTETDLTRMRTGVVGLGRGAATKRSNVANPEPYSAHTLRVGDTPWVNLHYTDESGLTGAKLQKYADGKRDEMATQIMSGRLTVAPIFHGDPLDPCAVRAVGGIVPFSLREASIALTDGGDMSIGWQKRNRHPSAGRIGVPA